jgi:hypothetical protein
MPFPGRIGEVNGQKKPRNLKTRNLKISFLGFGRLLFFQIFPIGYAYREGPPSERAAAVIAPR